jgi:rhodanese-related sulfurtransferase
VASTQRRPASDGDPARRGPLHALGPPSPEPYDRGGERGSLDRLVEDAAQQIAVDSPWRNLHIGGLDQQLILLCDHGYSSILAASNLVELGF